MKLASWAGALTLSRGEYCTAIPVFIDPLVMWSKHWKASAGLPRLLLLIMLQAKAKVKLSSAETGHV